MKGLMQEFPLTLDLVLRRALDLGASVEVVSRNAAGLDRRTWADVARRAVRVRGMLDTLGVPPGAPVATFAWNGHRHVELMLGVPCAGRVVHPVNARLLPEQVVDLMRHAGDRALFIDASLTPTARHGGRPAPDDEHRPAGRRRRAGRALCRLPTLRGPARGEPVRSRAGGARRG